MIPGLLLIRVDKLLARPLSIEESRWVDRLQVAGRQTSISFELTDVAPTADGRFVAKLPWRKFPGLLIEGQALQTAHPLVAALDSRGADANHIETITERLRCAIAVLDSAISTLSHLSLGHQNDHG